MLEQFYFATDIIPQLYIAIYRVKISDSTVLKIDRILSAVNMIIFPSEFVATHTDYRYLQFIIWYFGLSENCWENYLFR